ncbi:MAG TPA: aldo/keto reductase [Candidatus Oscillibacter excrementigallinarum]|uniref:Aldo/keto reductase n=1 Tax=Candidatus Oscillibacter excrementigallinarum TaxID=2838716 RepID=A0A9D2LI60_9FIRM|nr:aldo/keto reductase [Candidatus Oscillibacter excrementigallinarum]
MEYRIHPKTGARVSVIGIGTGPIHEATEREAAAALSYAYEQGVNYLDFATAGAGTFPYVGAVLGPVRKDLFYQVHFGANYESGEYGWTTDLDTIKRQVDWQLKELRTDYIDFGMIHCLDEARDWKQYQKNGVLDYLLELKRAGVVRHIGLSSHTPELAQMVLDTGLAEQLMFSINPAYDYQQGEYAIGSASERMDLYRRCEAEGIGISVMKPFSAGQLLDGRTSPFGRALTKVQCIQYALDKPGVLTVLPGIRGLQDMKEALAWLDASPEERDYAVLGTFAPGDAAGACVYCNHCQPCPAGLNIGLINKYYDLAKIGDAMAADHYEKLEKHASDCVGCGHCDRRCPFHVAQSDRMRDIAAYFGH